jgi:hypothetical protein
VGTDAAARAGGRAGQFERPQGGQHSPGALAARSCDLLCLPPSSPDFTPIEQAVSKLKALLRGLGARTREA